MAVKDLSEAMSAAVLVAEQIARLKASKGWADEAEVHRYGRSGDAGRQAGRQSRCVLELVALAMLLAGRMGQMRCGCSGRDMTCGKDARIAQ